MKLFQVKERVKAADNLLWKEEKGRGTWASRFESEKAKVERQMKVQAVKSELPTDLKHLAFLQKMYKSLDEIDLENKVALRICRGERSLRATIRWQGVKGVRQLQRHDKVGPLMQHWVLQHIKREIGKVLTGTRSSTGRAG